VAALGEELLCTARDVETRMRQDYALMLDLVDELDTRNIAGELGYPSLPVLLRDTLRITCQRRNDESTTRTQSWMRTLSPAAVSPRHYPRPVRHCARAI
jgi:hypothetical protein